MEHFINLNNKYEDIYIGSFNFKYAEMFFGFCTMAAVFPQIYKLYQRKKAKDFSMYFIFGMIIVNLLFLIVGFINKINGLMIGSSFFIIYNLTVVYYYFFGIQYKIKQISS
jgi:uncharacterized protein with PQ loop repeat